MSMLLPIVTSKYKPTLLPIGTSIVSYEVMSMLLPIVTSKYRPTLLPIVTSIVTYEYVTSNSYF